MERFLRTELLLGKEKVKKLRASCVTIVGLGAVGSYATEALARCGVGHLRVIDFDTVQRSNINRQLYALESTVGKKKTVCAKKRIRDINPKCDVDAIDLFAAEESLDVLFSKKTDLCIDAIDGVSAKVSVLKGACERDIPIISSMGAALRTDVSRIKVADLFETRCCPLAAHIRKRLRRVGIRSGIPCVYSDERSTSESTAEELCAADAEHTRGRKRRKLGSLPTITAIFGLTLAHVAIDMLSGGFSGEVDA